QNASAIRRLSSWNAFFSFQFSGACGAKAPTCPPEDPAPIRSASSSVTFAPRRTSSHPQHRPKIPPPTTVIVFREVVDPDTLTAFWQVLGLAHNRLVLYAQVAGGGRCGDGGRQHRGRTSVGMAGRRGAGRRPFRRSIFQHGG